MYVITVKKQKLQSGTTEYAIKLYQYIYVDFMGPIMLISFGKEQYFFMFTDNNTCITKTHIVKQKSEWFKYLKVFYNLVQIRTKLDQSIE